MTLASTLTSLEFSHTGINAYTYSVIGKTMNEHRACDILAIDYVIGNGKPQSALVTLELRASTLLRIACDYLPYGNSYLTFEASYTLKGDQWVSGSHHSINRASGYSLANDYSSSKDWNLWGAINNLMLGIVNGYASQYADRIESIRNQENDRAIVSLKAKIADLELELAAARDQLATLITPTVIACEVETDSDVWNTITLDTIEDQPMTYIAPTMPYNARYALIAYAINELSTLIQYDTPIGPMHLKHSSKSPITTISPSNGQDRVVSYKTVKIITMKLGKDKYSAGESWGLRYGIITLDKTKHIVKSRLQSNGTWSQWELL